MLNRRSFMACGSASILVPLEVAQAQVAGAASSPSAPAARTRRDVSSGAAAADLAKYRSAVAQLIALPTADPRQWGNLAKQHNDFCPHSNWWFLPWHRAYIFYFERVCQDVLGDANFTLPYWDWTQNPRIPGPFWSGVLAGNSVNPTVTRVIGPNDDIGSEFVGRKVINQLMSNPQLASFYSSAPYPVQGRPSRQRDPGTIGTLEGTPHNNVHTQVSGTMETFMSPLDPIFWLHHANVDRLWASWQDLHSGAAPTGSDWTDLPLGTFWDAAKKQPVAEPTSRTVSLAPYGYAYDRLERPPEAAQANLFTTFAAAMPSLRLTQLADFKEFSVLASVASPIKVNASQQTTLKTNSAFDQLVLRNAAPKTTSEVTPVSLVLEDVKAPVGNRISLRVFLNCKNPSLKSPIDDPSYVGTVSVFGLEHQHEGMPQGGGASFSLDATETLAKLSIAGAYKPGVVDVAIVVVSPDSKASGLVVRPGKVALVAAGT